MIDWSKFKALADKNLNVTEMSKFVFDRKENIVRKGEIVGYQHFLLFPLKGENYQTTKFRPDQIESICRRQIKCKKHDGFCL